MTNAEQQLNNSAGPRVILGIGNVLEGDDGVGPYLAGLLADSTWVSLDCGTAPEHFTTHLRRLKPSLVVMVDAAVMGLPPGSIRQIDPESVGGAGFTTHTLPLSLLARFIRAEGPEVRLIGIEPAALTPGEDLTPAVQDAAHRLADILRREEIDSIPCLE